MEICGFRFPAGCHKKIRGRIDHGPSHHGVPLHFLKMELSLAQIAQYVQREGIFLLQQALSAYVIAYNSSLPLLEIIYLVFHELGHIYFGHIAPGSNTTATLEQQESAADHFAAFIFSKIGV